MRVNMYASIILCMHAYVMIHIMQVVNVRVAFGKYHFFFLTSFTFIPSDELNLYVCHVDGASLPLIGGVDHDYWINF